MVSKSKVIPQKIIKEKVVDEYFCDICGINTADNKKWAWYGTFYESGDVVAEWSCPLDLCDDHKYLYQKALYRIDKPFDYMKERYDPDLTQEKKDYLIEIMSNLEC